MPPKPQPSKPLGFDPLMRGNKGPSPLHTTLFVLLRLAVPAANYALLATPLVPGALSALGLRAIAPSVPLHAALPAPAALLSAAAPLGLSVPRALLLATSVLTAAKQISWVLAINQEALTLSYAVSIPAIHLVSESAAAALHFWARTSNGDGTPSAAVLAAAAVFALGLAVEWASEAQRRAFKDQPRNRGKPHTGGLFGLARHINYTGFTAWKAGAMAMAGGWALGAGVAAAFFWDFANRAIPILDSYCSDRYGQAWSRYKEQVPYKMVPGVY